MPELKESLHPMPGGQRSLRRFRKAHSSLTAMVRTGRRSDPRYLGLTTEAKWLNVDPQYVFLTPESKWRDIDPQYVLFAPGSKWPDADPQYVALTPGSKWRDSFVKEWKPLRWSSHGITEQGTELERECAALRQRNEQLSEQISELRKLLAKLARRQSDDNPQTLGNLCDSRASAAEMLASVDAEGFEVLVQILKNEEIGINDLLESANLSQVVRLVSWLSSCHAVTMQDDSVTRTDFGQQLFVWLMDSTELKTEE